MSIIEIRYLCCNQYLLDDAIFIRLEFYYKTKAGRNVNDKVVRLIDEDKITEKILELKMILEYQLEYLR